MSKKGSSAAKTSYFEMVMIGRLELSRGNSGTRMPPLATPAIGFSDATQYIDLPPCFSTAQADCVAHVAALDLAKVQKNIHIVQYEQAIPTRFREVADALAGRSTLDSQIAADRALLEATSETYRLSETTL